MAKSEYLRTLAYNLVDEISNTENYLSSEVNGGKWRDFVGESYLKYIKQIERTIDSLKNTVGDLCKIETALENCNTDKDEAVVKSLESSVNRL